MALEALQCQSNLTLCDYFALIGFEKKKGLQIDKFAEAASDLVASSSTENLKSPLDHSYEAKILSHFPSHREGFPFAFEIASLCMPKGLRLYTERNVPKEPNFHSFVLVKEDGSRINGCALIFYEPLLDIEIRQQIYDLQMEQIRQMTAASTASTENISLIGNDGAPFVPRHARQFLPGTISSGNHTLPRKVLSKRSGKATSDKDSSTESPRRRRNCSTQNRKRISFYDNVNKPIFISKCICFVTRAPIVYSVENLLRSLCSMINNKFLYLSSPILPLESVLYWSLHEVPLPLPGTCLQVSYGACNLIVKRPSSHELPLFDYPIQILFNYISIERFIKLFTCFMLEHQILLCSKFMDRLMLVAECLGTLIFPFRWQLTYVPILPYSQLKFIEAPVPYLMGLCYDDKIPEQIFQSNVCIFDIDTGKLDYPEDIPAFPRQRQIFEQILQIQQRFCSHLNNLPPDKLLSTLTEPTSVVMRRKNRSLSKSQANDKSSNDSNNKTDQKLRRRNDLLSSKRMSRSFDNNISFNDPSICDEINNIQQDETLEKLKPESIPINKNVFSTKINESNGKVLENCDETIKENDNIYLHQKDLFKSYLNGLKFNHLIRELFLCHFASLFATYEHFLIGSHTNDQEKENRESVVNFDKASFLSDQPESYLPFLAAFLETQMFTSFVDAKILSHLKPLSEESKYILYFDRKIQFLLSLVENNSDLSNNINKSTFYADNQTHVTERPLDFLFTSSNFLRHQNESIKMDIVISADYEVAPPHLLLSAQNISNETDLQSYSNQSPGLFPDLCSNDFEVKLCSNISGESKVMSSPWKQQNKKQRVLNVLEDVTSRLTPNSANFQNTSTENPMRMAHQNWRFVEQLLKETKTKTKRMLVAKMGKEAVHLGHGDLGITGVEENTLVAGFCDLLERIWAHGLKKKQGKSALWSNIFAHYDSEKFENFKPIDRYSNLSSDFQNNKHSENNNTQILPVYAVNNENSYAGAINNLETNQKSSFDNLKTLNDFIDSIRTIASSIELAPIDGINKEDNNNKYNEKELNKKLDSESPDNELMVKEKGFDHFNDLINLPVNSELNFNHNLYNKQESNKSLNQSLINTTTVDNRIKSNWFGSIRSTSLIRAANFICDKIVSADVPQLVAKHSSISSFFNDESGDHKNNSKKATVDNNKNINFSRGRSTEKKSNTNSDSSLPPEERRRDKSQPRFYHHEDDYSKKLRGASRQRREAAALAAKKNSSNATTKNNNILNGEKNNLKNLPPHSQFIQNKVLPNKKTSLGVINSSNENVADNQLKLLNENNIKVNNDSLQKNKIGIGMRRTNSVNNFSPNWSAKGFTNNDIGLDIGFNSNVFAGDSHTLDRVSGRNKQARKRSLSRTRDFFLNRGVVNGQVFDAERNLMPLPTHMAYDLKNIMRMTEIKTDIGFARAFVRLALERKLLYKHLKSVLSDTYLLQKIYKRYSFLRCEDEREQFLYHVLSLNAVDFSCFTHTFISTKMIYQVLLVSSIDRFFSSSVWIMLAGSLGSTSNLYLPSNSLQFTFDYKNLGVLSTLRIGHSTNEKESYPSKWFLEYVLVRNNITAQTFCFNCGRWFGRGVDDGALERLLVAENFYSNSSTSELDAELESFEFFRPQQNNGSNSTFGFNSFISRPESPVSSITSFPSQKSNNFYYSTGSLTRRRRSPSVSKSSEYVNTKHTASKISELQHKLGMSVNALVKHFFTEKDYRSGARLTPLLCGENGLVSCLEQVFELGRQDSLFSNRFFRQPYPWDYIERVFSWFANFFRNGESRKLTREQRSLIIYAYNLVIKISANTAVGKEGKFHIFILLTLRDHIISGLLPLMAWTPITSQIYDESALLCQPHHLTYLSKLLNSLNEFNFTLEKSLIYGIEL